MKLGRHGAARSLVLVVIVGGTFPETTAYPVELRSGDIVFADQFSQSIVKLDPATGAQVIISQATPDAALPYPGGIALYPNGDILVADGNGGGLPGSVVRIDARTGS